MPRVQTHLRCSSAQSLVLFIALIARQKYIPFDVPLIAM
jgi:hypothetical protein